MADGQGHLLTGMRPQVCQRRVGKQVREDREPSAIDGDDEVARVVIDGRAIRTGVDLHAADEPGRGRRGVHLHARHPDVRDGIGEPRDEREDEPRQQEVHDHASEQDHDAGAQPLVGERAWILGDALLSFQAHEAADGQPVEGVHRVLAAMQDPRARREADPEFVDPHAGRPGHREVAELMEHHERHQDDQQQHDVDEAVKDHHRVTRPS